MKPLAIFKVGDTFPSIAAQLGDFEHWIVDGLEPHKCVVQEFDPRQNITLPNVPDISGAIISGSHSMVTDKAPWSERLAAWLREAVPKKLPILGICFGHQLLAHAFGGNVENHPGGLEIGSVNVKLTDSAKKDLLFSSMPCDFAANAVHRQSVRTLPDQAVLLASNSFERHQAFRIGSRAWGVQFHPEFGEAAMQNYIWEIGRQAKNGESIAIGSISQVVPTAESANILRRFANLVTQVSNERPERLDGNVLTRVVG